jgi:type 1 glutamine amidotransferase
MGILTQRLVGSLDYLAGDLVVSLNIEAKAMMLCGHSDWAWFGIFSFAVIACLAVKATAFEKPRMLMVTQSKGYQHAVVTRGEQLISPAEKAIKKLAAESGSFEVDFSQDAQAHVTKENLQNYDIVVFYTSGDLPINKADLRYLLGEWVKQPGHGFIGIHSASDTFKEYQPYWDFVGGTFNGHPWDQNSVVAITVHDPAHPAAKPFGKEFELQEEIYQYVNWQPQKVRVLMSLDMEKTQLKRPYHVPVAWVKQVGEGKLFYTNLGHRRETWENPLFIKSLEGAIGWIVGAADGKSIPNPDVSDRQDQLSKKAAEEVGITLQSLQAEERAQR